MIVTLLHNSPLHLAAHGARTCWDSHDKSDTAEVLESAINELLDNSNIGWEDATELLKPAICGPADAALIDRVGNKFKHASILEHLNYTFYIEGISRACLQELSRHRHTSPSVKSTRYTLKELKEAPDLYELYDQANETTYDLYTTAYWKACSVFLVSVGDEAVDWASCTSLMRLQKILLMGISNDKAKYCMPESYRVTEQLTINARSLQNFISLRSDKSALWEIRDLAHAIFAAIPDDHKYLFEDHLKH